MKSIILATIVASTLTFASIAQACEGGKRHHGNKGAKDSMLVSALGLSEQQQASIKDIRAQYRASFEAEYPKGTTKVSDLDPSAADFESQVTAIMQEKAQRDAARIINRSKIHSEISAILTPEQQEEFDALKEARKQRRALKRNN